MTVPRITNPLLPLPTIRSKARILPRTLVGEPVPTTIPLDTVLKIQFLPPLGKIAGLNRKATLVPLLFLPNMVLIEKLEDRQDRRSRVLPVSLEGQVIMGRSPNPINLEAQVTLVGRGTMVHLLTGSLR